MPLDDYEGKACGHEFDELIRMADREKPTRKKCPECGRKKVKQVLLGSPPIVDPVNVGRKTTDGAFKEVISKIKEKSPGNTITTDGRWRS